MSLGDFVDRGEDVPGALDLVFSFLDRPAGGSAVLGYLDLALVRAARLDDGPARPTGSSGIAQITTAIRRSSVTRAAYRAKVGAPGNGS